MSSLGNPRDGTEIYIYQRVDLLRIEKEILAGSYRLSPFWIKSELRGFPFKMDQITFFRFETLADFDRELYEFYLCLKLEDELVLISLASTLTKDVFTPNVFVTQSFACRPDTNSKLFLAEITNWSNLRLLLVIDFSIFKKILCRKRLYFVQKPLIDDLFIINLIDSFLNSPILDKKGENRAGGIPPVRFLRPKLQSPSSPAPVSALLLIDRME
ncbi:unnamed protein product [Dovyalis caffra]|uniref:Maturase K n=1 Tax=Dovyalis caffra TaxID=77055 RepID=A0AAV1QTZ0_9ROSI|nr:unnamed protein product [Dovyalis caffra]